MNSNIPKIKRLLSLYESGLTSLADEMQLRQMLAESEALPEELKAYADIVLCMSAKPDVDVPDDLAQTLSATVDRLSKKEKAGKRGNRWMAMTGIAASLAIVASAATFLLTQSKPSPYEVTDPEEASRRSVEALMTVAQGLKDADRAMKESCLLLNKIISEQLYDSIAPDSLDHQSIVTADYDSAGSIGNASPSQTRI